MEPRGFPTWPQPESHPWRTMLLGPDPSEVLWAPSFAWPWLGPRKHSSDVSRTSRHQAAAQASRGCWLIGECSASAFRSRCRLALCAPPSTPRVLSPTVFPPVRPVLKTSAVSHSGCEFWPLENSVPSFAKSCRSLVAHLAQVLQMTGIEGRVFFPLGFCFHFHLLGGWCLSKRRTPGPREHMGFKASLRLVYRVVGSPGGYPTTSLLSSGIPSLYGLVFGLRPFWLYQRSDRTAHSPLEGRHGANGLEGSNSRHAAEDYDFPFYTARSYHEKLLQVANQVSHGLLMVVAMGHISPCLILLWFSG